MELLKKLNLQLLDRVFQPISDWSLVHRDKDGIAIAVWFAKASLHMTWLAAFSIISVGIHSLSILITIAGLFVATMIIIASSKQLRRTKMLQTVIRPGRNPLRTSLLTVRTLIMTISPIVGNALLILTAENTAPLITGGNVTAFLLLVFATSLFTMIMCSVLCVHFISCDVLPPAEVDRRRQAKEVQQAALQGA